MERWEQIERYVLVIFAVAMAGWSAWFLITERGLRQMLALPPLPFAFWALWQAFYEDKLESEQPPTASERAMALLWVVVRRLVLGSVGLCFAVAAIATVGTISSADGILAWLLCLALACSAFWVAWFGAGREKSATDDVTIYRARRRRYSKWR